MSPILILSCGSFLAERKTTGMSLPKEDGAEPMETPVGGMIERFADEDVGA